MSERNIVRERMAAIFDEWNRRAAEDPEQFGPRTDSDGNPRDGYGEACADYFAELAHEMDQAGELPKA